MSKNRLAEFKTRHELSVSDLAAIICVSPATIRKYLAPAGKAMHRSLNPVAAALLDYVDERHIPLTAPIVRQWTAVDNAAFDAACGERSNADVAEALRSDRTTAYRWRRDLDVPPPAAKLVTLMNAFGWPEPRKALEST